MMWGYGQNIWWMWLWGVLFLVGIAVLVLLAIRVFGSSGRGWPAGPGHSGALHPGSYGPPPYGPPTGGPGPVPGGPGPGGGGPPPGSAGPGVTGRSQARLILDERFARGELTAEQYREHVKELGESP